VAVHCKAVVVFFTHGTVNGLKLLRTSTATYTKAPQRGNTSQWTVIKTNQEYHTSAHVCK